MAVNLSVPILYPKLRAKYGKVVTYEDDPKKHIMVEFGFDVVQVAAGVYAPNDYHDFIGFKVSKPLLDRAFSETYGLELHDVLFIEDLALGTYRYAAGKMIPPPYRGGMAAQAGRNRKTHSWHHKAEIRPALLAPGV